MQDIHSIGGGRFFDGGGGGAGGDRRLRPHHHNNQQNQQALKCPRCDSLNTKFCYYNNYNLSQPRHFCKNCRRYWTKGGVLRNVPVGGGCRKSKRSKPKTSSSSETAVRAAPPPPPPPSSATQPPNQDQHKSNSHSSSESSSLTASATEAASIPSSSNCELLNNQRSNSNPNFESGVMEQAGNSGIFSEIGSFTSMISATSEALSFGFGNIPETSSFRFGGSTTTQQGGMGNELLSGEWQAQGKEMGISDVIPPQQELKLSEIMSGPLLDQPVPVDLSALQSKTENGGFGSLDWQASADQGLFDLPNTVDHSYWSHAHWTDQDHPGGLFHLP